MYIRCTSFVQFNDFSSQRPHKRCFEVSHLQKYFNFALSCLMNLLDHFLVWCRLSSVGRTRTGLRDSLKNLEQNQNVFYDQVTFLHLFMGSCKIKSRTRKK